MSTNVGTGGEVVDIDLLTTNKTFAITKAKNNNLEIDTDLVTNLLPQCFDLRTRDMFGRFHTPH